MIKLFRRIRQGLIAKNNVSSYFLYALGEIVLVVIGILIALAINNSVETQKLRAKEQNYLIGLQNEFEISRSKLEELISVNSQNYEGAKTMLDYISGDKKWPGEADFSKLMIKTFSYDVSFNPNNSLLDEMINSGSLKDISNNQLRIRLTTWISTLEDIARQENDLDVQRERVVDFLRRGDYSLRTIFDLSGLSENVFDLTVADKHSSNLSILQSREFENNLLLFLLTSQATEKSHYAPLLQDLTEILDLIKKEIIEK